MTEVQANIRGSDGDLVIPRADLPGMPAIKAAQAEAMALSDAEKHDYLTARGWWQDPEDDPLCYYFADSIHAGIDQAVKLQAYMDFKTNQARMHVAQRTLNGAYAVTGLRPDKLKAFFKGLQVVKGGQR